MLKKQKSDVPLSIGGQALIEGIMMKCPKKVSTVIRKSDGSLAKRVQDCKNPKDKFSLLGWPFIRGVVGLIDSLYTGMNEITYSASFFAEDELAYEEKSKFESWFEKKLGDKADSIFIGAAVVLSIVLSVALFFLLPAFLVSLIPSKSMDPLARSFLEGAVRISILLAYIFLVSKMKDIKRVFAYHGAEHKTIFAYEKGEELTVENVRMHSRFHPRCGTNFLFIVMFISILVFAFIRWDALLPRFLMRLALLPVVAGISYELIKISGSHDNIFTKIVCAPGLWLQRMTTKEPDDSMIEVAIAAVNLALERENLEEDEPEHEDRSDETE